MINNKQIDFLAKIADLNVHKVNEIVTGISYVNNDSVIKHKHIVEDKCKSISYDYFKEQMGLEDIRFGWLLGENNFLAGGSVLNWIWQENTNEDTDFFFKDPDSAETFGYFLQSIGLIHTKSSGYASTYFSPDNGAIIQAVGTSRQEAYPNPLDNNFGPPEDIIAKFDIHVCKFALTVDTLFYTRKAIENLIKLELDITENIKPHNAIYRINKYTRKGFYPSTNVQDKLQYK